MKIVFFARNYPFSLLIRLWTWRWREKQKWKDVPSHCAVVVDSRFLFESLKGEGVCRRRLQHSDLNWMIDIPADDKAARVWLIDQLGEGYDWAAIFADVWGRWCKTLEIRALDNQKWTCSRLTAGALEAAGVDVPDQRLPMSPNDLYKFLKEQYHV